MTWEHGQPDPLCVLCGGEGRVTVRAEGPVPHGARRVVAFARLIPVTVEVTIEASAEGRTGDRAAACPSCTETDEARVQMLEGARIAASQKAARRG